MAVMGAIVQLLIVQLAAAPTATLAQLSPNCERNGRRDHCALTPMPDAANPQQTVDTIVFADHSVYQLRRDASSCRSLSPSVTSCAASIRRLGAGDRSLAATYRGTAYEGGYRHEYQGRGIRIVYVFLD